MTLRGWVVAFSLLLPVAFLSGCVDCASGPPVTARGIGPEAPSDAGSGDFSLTILATDGPGGAPLAGAGIAVYWARDDAGAWSGNATVVAEADGDGGRVRVNVDPRVFGETPEPKSTLRLRTDARGEGVAHVPSGRIVGVVVAADGFTEEWTPALATGNANGAAHLEVPLYRARLNLTLQGEWGPAAASTGEVSRNNYEWNPLEVPFGENEEARGGYLARLHGLQLALEWTNGLDGYGDLGIALGPTRDAPTHYEDDHDDVEPGDHREELALDATRLREIGVLASPAAYLGPGTDSGYAAPFGIPYRLHVDAHFDTAAAARATCGTSVRTEDGGMPGASVPMATLAPLAGLALAAALRRRPPA